MPLNQWGPWTPDVSDYEGGGVKNISNVLPRGDGYGPFPSFSAYTAALSGPCRGGFYALKSDGTVLTFAGTATKLYQLNNTNFTWTDVSLGGGTYSALTSTANWQFAQFGSLVFATQANAPLQVFDLSSATAFSNALGSPPQAAYISVVGRFLVLSGLLSTPYRIQWSGLNSVNASASWTSGINSSDFQDFPDGGIVRGVAGGDQSGIIFQDQAIRSMAYVAGSPIIFQITKLTSDKGLYAPYSIIRAGENIFFFANQGFHKIPPGGVPEQIGRERIDKTFLGNLDNGNLQLFIGAADPRSSRIYWAYKSNAGSAGNFDTLLGYDFVLDRFFQLSVSGQYLLGISQSGLTLENLDAIAPGTIAITGTANNGAGLIRISVASTAALISGNDYAIDNVGGTTEANGNWQISVVSATTFDLITNSDSGAPSAYVNAYTSGGIVGGSLDAMTLSLDSYATAVQPQLAAFNSANMLGFFTGPNLQGIIQGAEQGTDGRRITLSGFRPITDAATLYGSVSYRDTQAATPIVSAEVGMSSRTGRIDIRRDSRYQRYQVRIPAGTNWTFAAGYEPDVTANGTQ
jgi:hypothetical protein